MQKSGEDYLEAILVQEIRHDSDKVRSTDIARHLGVSRPSVSRAMSILKAEGSQAGKRGTSIFPAGDVDLIASQHLYVHQRDIAGGEYKRRAIPVGCMVGEESDDICRKRWMQRWHGGIGDKRAAADERFRNVWKEGQKLPYP